MNNKLFLIVAICAMFASCNKSISPTDPDPKPTPTTDPEKTMEFVIPIMEDGHRDFFELQYEFDLNGTKVTFKESEMTEMTPQEIAKTPLFAKKVDDALTFSFGVDHKETAQLYKYTLGKLKKGETVSGVSRKPIIRTDRSTAEMYNIFLGGELLVEGKEDGAFQEVTYHKGLDSANDKINLFFSIIDKDFKNNTYTVSK